RLDHLRFPRENAHVRVDTGVAAGDAVSIHYDPMIAKLIVWDATRDAALRRLRGALAECEIVGVANNIRFLSAVASHKAFAAGEVDTGFIGRHRADLVPERRPAPDRALALATLAVLLDRRRAAAEAAARSADPWSPWHRAFGWRLNDGAYHVLKFRDGAADISVVAHFRGEGFVLDLPGGALAARGDLAPDGRLSADLGGTRLMATVVRRGDEITVLAEDGAHALVLYDPLVAAEAEPVDTGRLTAPMPGKIVAVRVKAGARVKRGAPLLVLEAMKMEHTIAAPADGVVESIRFAVGEQVEEGVEMIGFKPAAEA
ncbi:MAG: 3-methylcrotonyl-CoA carboxylase, partial [Rhodospirillales bacterium]|nr:3-methylcrotonyl-CoA carboxylase [Rhodospirillales bacterium]